MSFPRHPSPNCLLIWQHYQKLGLAPPPGRKSASGACGWNVDRVHRLCRYLTISPWELGALAAVNHSEMSRYLKFNRFPPPVALHFALIESWYLSELAGLPQKPIVPIALAL